jgi:hypothetical protein
LDNVSSSRQNIEGKFGKDVEASLYRQFLMSVRIELTPDHCLCTIPVGDQIPFQIFEVFLGPLDLNPNQT